MASNSQRLLTAMSEHLAGELDAGRISQHDHDIGLRIVQGLDNAVKTSPKRVMIASGLGGGAAYLWATRVRRPPAGLVARVALVVGAAVLVAPIPLALSLSREAQLLGQLDDLKGFREALARADSAIRASGGRGAAAQAQPSAWDTIRDGRAPDQPSATPQTSATPVQDALAAAAQSRDVSKDDERRQWEEMLAKEREISKDK